MESGYNQNVVFLKSILKKLSNKLKFLEQPEFNPPSHFPLSLGYKGTEKAYAMQIRVIKTLYTVRIYENSHSTKTMNPKYEGVVGWC